MNRQIRKRLLYFSLLILLIIPLFQHLGAIPIQTWDEARVAVNAYEMQHNHNFMVTHFNGKPDLWNTKPPFLIWLQVLSASIFGISEFSLRLPSAIAAFLTCILLFQFSKKYFDSFWMGVITSLVLVCSVGYVSIHGTRTLDYESLLTLFSTLSLIAFFNYTQSKNNKYLYVFFLSLALGVLTKSVTILIFSPALLLFLLLQKQLLELLKNKHLYFSLLLFLSVVLGYYISREIMVPGYLKAIYENELGGRYLTVLEKHNHGFWYYFENIISERYTYWHLLFPVGLTLGFLSKKKKIRVLTQFLTLTILVFFLVISTAQTKLKWYDTPLYPLLALITSLPLFNLFKILDETELTKNFLRTNVLPYIFLFFTFISPYKNLINETYKPVFKGDDYIFNAMSYHLKSGLKHPERLDNKSIVYQGYNTQLLYYVNLLHEKKINIDFKGLENLSPGDTVILSQKEVDSILPNLYNYQLLSDKNYVKTYIIHDRK